MTWLIKFAASKFAPWILLGGALAIAYAFAFTYGAGKTNGVNQERAAQASAIADAVAKAKADHEADLKARGWQDAKEAQEARAMRGELLASIAELAALPPKTLIKTVEVTNETGSACPVPTLGPEFWLRFQAAVDRYREAGPSAAGAVRSRM